MAEHRDVNITEQSAPDEKVHRVKALRVETLLFLLGVLFFVPVGIIYGLSSDWEPVGTVGFALLGGMYVLIGGYLWILSSRMTKRPEDDPYGEISEGEGQVGDFSPHSWWPLVLGVAVTVVFAGIPIGLWLVLIGAVVAAIGLVGMLFEFSRGIHAH